MHRILRILYPLLTLILWIVQFCLCTDFYHDHWKCNYYLLAEAINIHTGPGKLLEIHIRDNIQGEVEIKDSSKSNVVIEIEKLGATEERADSIIVNQTIFDVGHGTIFLLQLDYVAQARRRAALWVTLTVTGSLLLTLITTAICCYHKQALRSIGSTLHVDTLPAGGDLNPQQLSSFDSRHQDNGKTAEEEEDYTDSAGRSSPLYMAASDIPGSTRTDTLAPRVATLPRALTSRGSLDYRNCIGNDTARVSAGTMGRTRVPGGSLTVTTLSLMTLLTVVAAVYETCPSDPVARVILFIPPVFRLDAVKLFFRLPYQNTVVTNDWFHRNGTVLQVFDLEDARPTSNTPCSARLLCPNAYLQNLGGCDAGTNQCICERGYMLERGVCKDLNECMTPLHKCPATATCQNINGSYLCHCGYGYYGSKKTCTRCSVGCPEGTYESSPCTTNGDRVCLECSKCKGSMYEAKPCGGISDRKCIHVAKPLSGATDDSTDFTPEDFHDNKYDLRKRRKLKVEHSLNVFAEDLHSTRHLETMYYVTDSPQASDFFWDRESGMRISVGVHGVHLIPEYEDVPHKGDNQYMVHDPNSSGDKEKFQRITSSYCRNPVPDYYSITLEIFRDRTTVAHTIKCDSKNSSLPKCPYWYKDGDKFLYRTPNEGCVKMGTHPETLQSLENSIVCTDPSDLLHQIFNQSYSTVRPISFPSNKCRTAVSRCDQCTSQSRCQSLDVFEKKCCEVDCYTLADCKIAYSEECINSPILCAMGDAYRYTIQPIYDDISKEFQCHIKRRKTNVLYEIFYFIEIPSINYKTDKKLKKIYAPSTDAADLSFEMNQADFLSIEHNSGLNVKEEFMLRGLQAYEDHFNYSLHLMWPENLKQDSGNVDIHEISKRIFVASVQFEKPFDYSTSAWGSKDHCWKNVSKFRRPVKRDSTFYKDTNVAIQNNAEPFRYFLKSISNPPYIRLSVPGNISVLSYYFKHRSAALLLNDSLSVKLELTSAGRVWEIHIAGKMSDCPAYLGIVIISQSDSEELFRHDLLIQCPADFSIVFKVPNRFQQTDRTFDLRLDDSTRTYQIHLTHLTFTEGHLESDSALTNVKSPEAMKMPKQDKYSFIIFLIITSASFFCLIILVAVYVYTEIIKDKMSRKIQRNKETYDNHINSQQTSSMDHINNESKKKSCNQCRIKRYIFSLYIFLRISYSLIFTFTTFYIVVSIMIKTDVDILSNSTILEADKGNLTAELSQSIERHGYNELMRQKNLVENMQSACNNYIGEQLDKLSETIEKVMLRDFRQKQIISKENTITGSLMDRTREQMKRYTNELLRFKSELRTKLSSMLIPVFVSFRNNLQKLYNNQWLGFPQLQFNASNSAVEEYVRQIINTNCSISGREVDFAIFLEIIEVDSIRLWSSKFWKRFEVDFPSLPGFEEILSQKDLVKKLSESCSIFNASKLISNNHLSTSHYFTSRAFDESVHYDKETYQHIEGESSQSSRASKVKQTTESDKTDNFISFFLEEIDFYSFRILFFTMDCLVFVYRCTKTYVSAKTIRRRFNPRTKQKNCDVTRGTFYNNRENSNKDNICNNYRNHLTIKNTNVPWRATESSHIGNHNGGAGSESADKTPPLSCRVVFGRLLENNAFPKALILCMLLLILYGCLKCLIDLIDMELLIRFNVLGVLVNALTVQVNHTNSYILLQSSYYNNVSLSAYDRQAQLELMNLQEILQLFNTEQEKAIAAYAADMCSMTQGEQMETFCDRNKHIISHIEMHLLPCNFVPIQPNLFSGQKLRDFEYGLEETFRPCVEALRNILIKSVYAGLVALTSMLVTHILGWIVCRCYRLRSNIPSFAQESRRVFVTSLPLDNTSSIQTFVHRISDGLSDYDDDSDDNYDDDDVMYCSRNIPPAPVQSTSTLTSQTFFTGQSRTMQPSNTDFKYSETNV